MARCLFLALIWLVGYLSKTTATSVPQSFMLNVSQMRVDDLRSRLSLARYPPIPVYEHERNSQGLETNDLRKFIDYWLNEFDWKLKEAELNQLKQYIIEIEDIKLHYLHIMSPSASSNKPLLLFVHGWPSTSFDFQKIVPLLDEFDLIAPSLPGFPLSSMPRKPGFGYKAVNL